MIPELRELRQLEFVLGAAFLLGPMVYALTLPTEEAGQCEASVVVEVPGECHVSVLESEPAPAIEPAPVPEPSAGPPAFAFGFVVGDGRYVVLATDVAASWGTGEFFEPAGEVDKRVGKQADLDRVDVEHRAALGRTFDVYGRFGKRCSARIDRLLVIAQYDWGIEGLELEQYDPETDEEIEHDLETLQQAVWTTQPRWLVGELDDDCGGLWARDAALPAPTILTYSGESSPTTRARIAQFEREELPALREDYEAFLAKEDPDGEREAWDVRMARYAPDVGAWLDTAGVARFVTLDYGFDDSLCGFGHPSEIEAFDVVENGAFVPTAQSTDVAAVFDADLDGRFELLYDEPAEGRPKQAWARVLDSSTEALVSELTVLRDHSGCEC